MAVFLRDLPQLFAAGEGRLVKEGRNVIREFDVPMGDVPAVGTAGRPAEGTAGKLAEGTVGKPAEGTAIMTVVVKEFGVPNIVNRLIYGRLRKSKAQRSYEYAQWLLAHGIGSPVPLAWATDRCGLLLGRSYYVSLRSACTHTFADLIREEGVSQSVEVASSASADSLCSAAEERQSLSPADEAKILGSIAKTTARLHSLGAIHRDYSRGNILWELQPDGTILVELVDLNRLRFPGSISVAEGLANLRERLPMTPDQWQVMETAYREARN